MEHVLRQSHIALRLADRLGLDAEQRRVVYYSSLLAWSGATSTPTSRRSGSATIRCSNTSFDGWTRADQRRSRRSSCAGSATRLVNLADVVEVFHHAGGIPAAVAVARERSGTQFDPDLVALFCDCAEETFAELDSVTSWPRSPTP